MSADEDRTAAHEAAEGATGTDLSFIVRMDFHVYDADAVISAAVSALQAADPDLPEDQARQQVGDVEDAVFTVASTLGLDALVENTNGLEVRAVVSEVAYGLEEITVEEDED